jgi:hypothetical protein
MCGGIGGTAPVLLVVVVGSSMYCCWRLATAFMSLLSLGARSVNVAAAAGIGDDTYGAKQPAKSRTLVVCPTSVRDLCIFVSIFVSFRNFNKKFKHCVWLRQPFGHGQTELSTVPFHEGSGTHEFK